MYAQLFSHHRLDSLAYVRPDLGVLFSHTRLFFLSVDLRLSRLCELLHAPGPSNPSGNSWIPDVSREM